MSASDYDLLKRFERLALAAERSGGGALLAAPPKKLPGGGTEPTGLRDYAAGDDYRLVDWTRCARRDELLTRLFEGRVDLHSYILLDCSASMAAGRPAKFALARQIVAALGYLALARLDLLGVAGFADGLVAGLPPLRHKSRIGRLLRFLGQLRLESRPTDLPRSLEAFTARRQRPGPVVIVSDFYDRGFARALDRLRYHGYEPRLVQKFFDPAEAEAGGLGDVELADVETGAVRRVTVTERMARRYRQLFAAHQQAVSDYCRLRRLPFLRFSCMADTEEVLPALIDRRVGIAHQGAKSEIPISKS